MIHRGMTTSKNHNFVSCSCTGIIVTHCRPFFSSAAVLDFVFSLHTILLADLEIFSAIRSKKKYSRLFPVPVILLTYNLSLCACKLFFWIWFQGYLVGNPVTDEKFDNGAFVPYAHGMGLISDELYEVKNYIQTFS